MFILQLIGISKRGLMYRHITSFTVLMLVSFMFKNTAYAQGTLQTNFLDTASLATLKAAIEENPDSLSYHEQFIQVFTKSKGATWNNRDSILSLIEPLYEKWMKQFPHSAIVPFALGDAYAGAESPRAKSYLLKAVKINPKLAEAWMGLSIDAERWGNAEAARKYMGKAAATKPDDPGYAFYYAMDFEEIDSAKWRKMLYDLVKRFPESERGAQSLYWLAYSSKDPAEKLKVFEQLRQWYPPKKFRWSESGMYGLFEIYLKQNPQKAVELTHSMGDTEGWPKFDTIARNFVRARLLMSQHKYEEAGSVLRRIKLPRYPDLSSIRALLCAKADDESGNTDSAYHTLVKLFAKEPTDELYAAIAQYGKKLYKNDRQIKDDVWKVRSESIKPAPPFDLGLYTSNGTLSLQDLRGKVLLLTFWFPGCGPCRGEFPHFQNVINKFKGKNVAYIGINVVPQQDKYVLPFMKGTGYTFIPLRGNGEWAEKVYKVRGEPTNFLIDQQGKIVFSHFRIDGNNERTLELMINSLLERNG